MKIVYLTLVLAFLAAPLKAAESLTLTLQQCREMALQHDEQIKSMNNQQLQSEIDKDVAFISYLPKVDGSVVGYYGFPDTETMGMKVMMHGMYLAGISLQETIYAGGRIHAGNDLAKIGYEVSQQKLRKTRQQVIADTDNAYWSYVAVQMKVEMLETYIQYIQSLFDKVKVSVDAEMATNNELLRINAKKTEMEYNYQKAKTGEELCRLMLCHTIGVDFETPIIAADKDIHITAPEAMDEDISANPDIVMMHQGIQAKEKQVKMARGEYLPSVVGMAGYSAYGNIKMKGTTVVNGEPYDYTQKMDSNSGYAAIMVSIPIWNWGTGTKKVKKAKLDVENAKLDLDRNTRLLAIQARQAVKNVQNGYLQVQTAENGLQQSEENLRVMNDQYENSMSTLTDLLDAQSQWQQAKSNLIEAQTQYKIYQTEYLKAVGRLE